nr:hypothetical protein [Tanacetum cinerariifolium]
VPSYTAIKDPLRRLSLLGEVRHLRRKQGSMMSGGHFIRRLAEHFGLLIEDRLCGPTMVIPDLTGLDMDELAIVAGASKIVEGAHADEESGQAVLTPVQAPQPPPLAVVRTMFTTWTVGRLSQLLDASGMSYTSYGDYQIPNQRRTRRRTDDARTSAPQQFDH